MIEANKVHLKHAQQKAVNCLVEGRDVFAVISTGYRKSFVLQLFAAAMTIKKVSEGQYSVLMICPVTSIIQDQVKEEKLDSAASKMSKICTGVHKLHT